MSKKVDKKVGKDYFAARLILSNEKLLEEGKPVLVYNPGTMEVAGKEEVNAGKRENVTEAKLVTIGIRFISLSIVSNGI